MSNVIYNYHILCQDVKNLDKKIRFAGVINERGRLVASKMKKDGHMVNEKDEEMLFMELALRVRMRKDFEDQLGKVKYSMTIRKEHVGMSFPIKTDFLYVATYSGVNLIELPLKIIKNIDSQKKNQNR
ncbi:MAG: hypothetical protein IIB02_07980 [Thaumarchaeota archaeon]|nr:hypothetical protein [Nitrososphaerota archaeon]